MALGTPTLATPTVSSATTSVVSASMTPTASALLVAFGASRASALVGAIGMSGGGLTWTSLAAALMDTGAGLRNRSGLYAAIVPSSPSAMTVTASSTSATRMGLVVVQITGQSGIPGNAIGSVNAEAETGDPSMVLGSAPAAASTVLCFGAFNGAVTVTPPAGFTELDELIATDLVIEVAYDAASAPTTNAYSTTNNRSTGAAVEVSGATGVGFRLRRRGPLFQHMLVR